MALRRREWLALGAGLCMLPAMAARHEQRRLFGSPVDLLLPPGAPAAAERAVWRGLEAMNTRWNAWKPGELTALNEDLARGRTARVTPALRALIVGAARMEQLSLGHFNAGIGGLVGAWGFHADALHPGSAPGTGQLNPWLAARPSLARLHVQGLQVHNDQPLLRLDFGAYAKGVALDWALDTLQRAGIESALLNLGGNLACMGQAEGRPWRVGVRNPHGPGLVAQIQTQGREAVVTSGSYERFRRLDGMNRGHVIDPHGGAPAAGLASVTVVHPNAGLADAAATALLVAGRAGWPAVARRMGVHEVLVIDDAGGMQASAALRARLG